ncbi:MAG TPA: hypothetical protein VG944_12725 [Fimbriimonas sp.]|nr:hypothetical protein [Fimbriimonas sp.]
MLGTMALSLCLLLGGQDPAPGVCTDLFLVANNSKVLQNLDWLKHPEAGNEVEAILAPVLLTLKETNSDFTLIDGGDCSRFSVKPGDRRASVIQREYSGFVSKSEGSIVNGVSKMHPIEYTQTESTTSMSLYPRPEGDYGYVSQGFLYFNNNTAKKPWLVVQDLNSLKTALTAGQSQDRANSEHMLPVTGESSLSSQRILSQLKPDFKGVCLCARGLTHGNFIAFPPAGVVSHYKLIIHGDSVEAQLVEILREPKQDLLASSRK